MRRKFGKRIFPRVVGNTKVPHDEGHGGAGEKEHGAVEEDAIAHIGLKHHSCVAVVGGKGGEGVNSRARAGQRGDAWHLRKIGKGGGRGKRGFCR